MDVTEEHRKAVELLLECGGEKTLIVTHSVTELLNEYVLEHGGIKAVHPFMHILNCGVSSPNDWLSLGFWVGAWTLAKHPETFKEETEEEQKQRRERHTHTEGILEVLGIRDFRDELS